MVGSADRLPTALEPLHLFFAEFGASQVGIWGDVAASSDGQYCPKQSTDLTQSL